MSFLGSAISVVDQLIGDAEVPYALIMSTPRYMGTLFPDAVVREVHTDEYMITQHPTEAGTPVGDHYFALPRVIEISCGFSDSSAGYVGYSQEIYQEFKALAATRQAFEVSTGKDLYENMLFLNVTVVTDETSEFALMVVARLQEVIMTDTSASSLSASTQADPASTASSVNAGTQTLQAGPSGFVPGGV